MNAAEAKEPLIPGVEVNLAGVDYTVPAITFEQVQGHDALINEINGEIESANAQNRAPLKILAKMLPIVGDAIRRNYPDLTDEKLGSIVDMRNLRALYRAALGVEDLPAKSASS